MKDEGIFSQFRFEIQITHAAISLGLPSYLKVAWKTSTNKLIASTLRDDILLKQGIAEIGQLLAGEAKLEYDKKSRSFSPKWTTLCLYCMKNGVEEKLVGRTSINLAQIVNQNAYSEAKDYKLDYCAAQEGTLRFVVRFHEIKQDLAGVLDQNPQNVHKEQQIRNMPEPIQTENTVQGQLLQKQSTGIAQLKEQLRLSQKRKRELEEKVLSLENKIFQIENDIVKELMNQVRTETEKRIQAENGQSQKLKQLTFALDQSEKNRLQFQAELLELRFELSELKSSNRALSQNTRKFEQDSEKDKLIQQLQRQIQKLTTELSEAGQSGGKFQQLGRAFRAAVQEKDKYFEELKAIQRQKFQLAEQKTQLQDRLMRPGDSIMMEQVVEKLTTLQIQFDNLKQELNNLTYEKEELLEETRKLEQENEDLFIKVKNHEDWEEQKIDLKKKFELVEQEKVSSDNENSQNKLLLSEKTKLLNQTIEELQIASLSNKDLQTKLSKLESECKKMDAQMKALRRTKSEEEREREQMNKEIIQLSKLRAEMQAKNIRLQNDIKTFELKIEKNSRLLKQKDEDLEMKVNKMNTLQDQLEKQLLKSHQLEAKMLRFAEKEIEMRQNILILEEQSKKIFDIIVQKQNNEDIQIRQLQEQLSQLDSLKHQNFRLKQLMASLTQDNKVLREEMFLLKEKAILGDSSKIEDGVQLTDSAVLRQELKKHQGLYQLQTNRIRELQQQAKNKASFLTEETAQLKEKTSQLQKYINEVQKPTISSLQRQNQILKGQVKDLEGTIEKLNLSEHQRSQKIANLGEQISIQNAQKQAALNFSQQEIKKLQTMVSTLQKENKKFELSLKEQKQILNETLSKMEKDQIRLIQLQKDKRQNSKEKDLREETIGHNKFKGFPPAPLSPPSRPENTPFVHKSDIISVCDCLRDLISLRGKKDSAETVISALMNKSACMEESLERITMQRGVIQETARKLSMEFAKIKSAVLKGRGNMQQKKQLISSMKPCEEKVKSLIVLAESLSTLNMDEAED